MSAPRRSPLGLRGPLPVPAGSAQADSLGDSVPDSSAPLLHIIPPPLPVSFLPALRIADEHIHVDTRAACRSTRPAADGARRRSTSAAVKYACPGRWLYLRATLRSVPPCARSSHGR